MGFSNEFKWILLRFVWILVSRKSIQIDLERFFRYLNEFKKDRFNSI